MQTGTYIQIRMLDRNLYTNTNVDKKIDKGDYRQEILQIKMQIGNLTNETVQTGNFKNKNIDRKLNNEKEDRKSYKLECRQEI